METPEEQPQGEPQSLPDPQSDPVEPIPEPEILEHVDVPCAGCGRVYGFDIQPQTATFTFVCRGCNTRSEWKRV